MMRRQGDWPSEEIRPLLNPTSQSVPSKGRQTTVGTRGGEALFTFFSTRPAGNKVSTGRGGDTINSCGFRESNYKSEFASSPLSRQNITPE
ncbi:unnamed protein product [Protopolystoma xenopodis]|uniref:Uncharacterized protein n=1 Tax=Protopolystoma xenopodis TaxID=117903 RepID=A0A3S5BUI2_9PLAT|nr:unnamed protein product [Protopolystoma xenopodis]